MNAKSTLVRLVLVGVVGLLLAGFGTEMTQARGYSTGGGNNTQPTTQRPTER